MRPALAVALVALTVACHEKVSVPAADISVGRVAERFALDLDGDGKPDSLTLYRVDTVVDPGMFVRLHLELSQSGAHDLVGRWDSARVDEHPFRGNAVASRVLLVGRFARGGTLIVLSGEDVGCCAQGIFIYRVSGQGVAKYFDSEQFIFTKPLVVQQDSVAVLEGVSGMTEVVSSSNPNALTATSYQPVLAIRLEETARLDTALSRELTSRRLGGFAGLEPRDDIIAVLARDSSRYLWDSLHGRRLGH